MLTKKTGGITLLTADSTTKLLNQRSMVLSQKQKHSSMKWRKHRNKSGTYGQLIYDKEGINTREKRQSLQ